MQKLKRFPWLALLLAGTILVGCSDKEEEKADNTAKDTKTDAPKPENNPPANNNTPGNNTPANNNTPGNNTPANNTPVQNVQPNPANEPPKDMTAQATAEYLMDSLAENRMESIWLSLPESYQTDINTVVRDFAGKMDAELWNNIFNTLKKLTKVLDTKRDFILGHPMVAPALQQNQVNIEETKQNWSQFISVLNTLVNSELSDLNRLKQFDGRTFMAGTVSQMGNQVRTLAKTYDKENQLANLEKATVTTVEEMGEKVKLRVEVPGQEPKETTWVKVEGKWVTEDMAQDWEQKIQQAKDTIANITPEQVEKIKGQTTPVLGLVNQILDSLQAANTQEEFNNAVNQAMATIGPMIPIPGAAGPEVDPGTEPTPEPEPADPEASVKVKFSKQLSEEDLDPLLNSIFKLTDNSNQALVQQSDEGAAELQISPVKDPQAFSEKLDALLKENKLGEVQEVNVEEKTITVNVTKE